MDNHSPANVLNFNLFNFYSSSIDAKYSVTKWTLVALLIPFFFLLKISFETLSRKLHLKQKARNTNKGWHNLPKLSILQVLWTTLDMKTAIKSWRNTAAKYGPLVRLSTFGEEFLILNSPAMAEVVYQKLLTSKNLEHTMKSTKLYEVIKDVTGNGIVVSGGKSWHTNRKILDRAFTYSALKSYMRVYNNCAKRLVSELDIMRSDKKSEFKQISSVIHNCGIEIITETVMGLDASSNREDSNLLFNSFNGYFLLLKSSIKLREAWITQIIFKSQAWLAPLWRLLPAAKKYDEAVRNINGVVKRMIEHQVRFNDGNSIENQSEDADSNMLSLMLKSGMSEKSILDEVKTMIIAGYETTSSAMHFLLFMLAVNQKHQNACKEEIDRVFEDTTKCRNGELTFDAMSDLKYLERCLLETLRMFPISFISGRYLEAPLKIGDDLEIPVGTNVIVSNLLFHESSDNFTNPEEFQPDRFLAENCTKRHPYSYIPFAAGPRNCIGMKYALLEAKTVVAHILREFDIYTKDDVNSVAIIPSIILRPQRDYYFLLEKRDLPHNTRI